MIKKIKIAIILLIITITTALGFYFLGEYKKTVSLTAVLPKPDTKCPYLMFECDNKNVPTIFTDIKSNGIISFTPNDIFMLKIASMCDSMALLTEKRNNSVHFFASGKISIYDYNSWQSGTLPSVFASKFPNAKIKTTENDKIKILEDKNSKARFYYAFSAKRLVMSTLSKNVEIMLQIGNGAAPSAGINKWKMDKKSASNGVLSDGGYFTKNEKINMPLKILFKWDCLEHEKNQPAGHIEWKVDAGKIAELFVPYKAVQWNIPESVSTEPSVLSMGINIPQQPNNFEEWQFPFSILGSFAQALGVNGEIAAKALAGRTIATFGGNISFIWMTVPGITLELTGDSNARKILVDSFWEKLFLNATPTPIKDFTYGGYVTFPIPTVAAGNNDITVFGLTKHDPTYNQERFMPFTKDKSAIAWFTAEPALLAKTLYLAMKLNKFSIGRDNTSIFDSDSAHKEEPFQPQMSITPFDSLITEKLCDRLSTMGRIDAVWEKPLSGYIIWHNNK